MTTKKENGKKGGFALAPITLSEPVKTTDGFTNLVETPAARKVKTDKPQNEQGSSSGDVSAKESRAKKEDAANQNQFAKPVSTDDAQNEPWADANDKQLLIGERRANELLLAENELLRILDADSLDEIYELTDVLRASSLKLYATLIRLADSRGRARVKNHELMSKAGIKGIATLYKQERWLMDLKLLEKKAKPGPHDGSSYVIHKLESLPLPAEIYEKFEEYLSGLK